MMKTHTLVKRTIIITTIIASLLCSSITYCFAVQQYSNFASFLDAANNQAGDIFFYSRLAAVASNFSNVFNALNDAVINEGYSTSDITQYLIKFDGSLGYALFNTANFVSNVNSQGNYSTAEFTIPNYRFKYNSGTTSFEQSTSTAVVLTSNSTSSQSATPFCVFIMPQQTYYDIDIEGETIIYDNSSGSGGDGSSGDGNVNVDGSNLYKWIASYIGLNYLAYNPTAETAINTNWISVGQALTAYYTALTNLTSPTLSVYNINGTITSFVNPFYRVLSAIDMVYSATSDTSDGIADLINAVPDISSIESDISSINQNIGAAFPSNERIINTAIATSVLDDSEGTGLTTTKVVQGKLTLDDNASIFALDTSGGDYSSPADAITHGDWSFWSQTTVDNLGSGYTFSIDSLDAELMGDNDIYDENISALRRLIGW